MTDSFFVAAVAVEGTKYSFDKLYDYLVPEEMQGKPLVGHRVRVSFGKSLRQGMVMSLGSREDSQGLKSISALIDNEPVLSGELVSLAVFMKERCYCTYFDACSAMIPAGLSVKLTYSYSPGRAGREELAALTEQERAAAEYVYGRKAPVREDRLMGLLSLEDNTLLKRLSEKGILERTDSFQKRLKDASVKMIRLREDVPERKYTASQSEVIRVLTETGEASVREICYFTGVTQAVTDNLVRKGVCEYFQEPAPALPSGPADPGKGEEIVLTPEQLSAYETLLEKYNSGSPSVTLLYGVTGSGKTSVFMKLIDKVNSEGRGVICMVPEISLTPQLLSKFRERYGDSVAVFHSGLSLGKRLEEWRKVREGKANIAVGTRSAIFAPLRDIGLIVMDEEQEYSYKSSATPRFHTRELAKFRCKENKCPLLLSSATPSVESYYNAVSGRYGLCILRKRYGAAKLPEVICADMNNTPPGSCFSGELLEAVRKNLDAGRQSILLLNRRGHNTFVSCRECSQAVSCPNCSISLTYHSANNRLMCHYCGYSVPVPDKCPSCGSGKLRFSGAGTQRAEQEVGELFPQARILRLDTDSTMKRYSYEKKLSAFRRGEYDIMLGTQMVAKGLDFENVTLAGVLSADGMMHSDDFRSYERTFSLLTQVVGRSGRGELEGRAVIQTCETSDPVIGMASRQDYEEFYRSEIVLRKAMLYPPFADLALVVFSGENRENVSSAALRFSEMLKSALCGEYHELPVRMLGPAPAVVARVGGKYRYRIIIKFRNSRRFRRMMAELLTDTGSDPCFRNVSVYADVDPDNII